MDLTRPPLLFRAPPPLDEALVASGGIPFPEEVSFVLDDFAFNDRPLKSMIQMLEQRRRWLDGLSPAEREAEDRRAWVEQTLAKIEYDMDTCPHCGHNPNDDWG